MPPCWKAQTTEGLRCSLRADCAKRGRFSTQPALSAAQSATAAHARSARRPRAVWAQTTCEVSVWSARWPHVQTVKFQQKNGTLHNVCMYYSTQVGRNELPAASLKTETAVFPRNSKWQQWDRLVAVWTWVGTAGCSLTALRQRQCRLRDAYQLNSSWLHAASICAVWRLLLSQK